MEEPTIDLVVCYADDSDNPTDIYTKAEMEITDNKVKASMTRTREITVLKSDWDAERINIFNVTEMLRQWDVKQLRKAMPWMGDQLAGVFGIR